VARHHPRWPWQQQRRGCLFFCRCGRLHLGRNRHPRSVHLTVGIIKGRRLTQFEHTYTTGGGAGHHTNPSASNLHLQPLPKRQHTDNESDEDEETNDAPGGQAYQGNGKGRAQPKRPRTTASFPFSAAAAAAAAAAAGGGGGAGMGDGELDSQAAESISTEYEGAGGGGGSRCGIVGPAAGSSSSTAAASAAASAPAPPQAPSNQGGAGADALTLARPRASQPHSQAQLLGAFQNITGLLGVLDELGALLERLRAATEAVLVPNSPDLPERLTEANEAFNALGAVVWARLREARAAALAAVDGLINDVQARLEAHGLQQYAAAVIDGAALQPLQPLHQALAQAELLEQARAVAAQAAAWSTNVPAGVPDALRAAVQIEAPRLQQRVQELEGELQQHGAPASMLAAIAELQSLVANLHQQRERATALSDDHERRIFGLWGTFLSGA